MGDMTPDQYRRAERRLEIAVKVWIGAVILYALGLVVVATCTLLSNA